MMQAGSLRTSMRTRGPRSSVLEACGRQCGHRSAVICIAGGPRSSLLESKAYEKRAKQAIALVHE